MNRSELLDDFQEIVQRAADQQESLDSALRVHYAEVEQIIGCKLKPDDHDD